MLPGDSTPEAELDSYHRIHPTWVCTQALRDRDFPLLLTPSHTFSHLPTPSLHTSQALRDRDFRVADNQFWPELIAKVLIFPHIDTGSQLTD